MKPQRVSLVDSFGHILAETVRNPATAEVIAEPGDVVTVYLYRILAFHCIETVLVH